MRRLFFRLALVSTVATAACSGSELPTKKDFIGGGDFDLGGGDSTVVAVCGDGVLTSPEVCDGALLGGRTCASQGFAGGTLSCRTDCTGVETSGCTAPSCGDGIISAPNETCEGTDFGGKTCQSLGFASGALACNTCQINTAGCVPATCGNARKEGTEACDGADLGGQTCALQGRGGGTLACAGNCAAFDFAGCTNQAAECGNGAIDGIEACDGAALASETCATLGLGDGNNDGTDNGGTLACAGDCRTFDTAACENPLFGCAGPDSYRGGGINTNLAAGEPCNYDGDCAAGQCNSSFFCGDDAVAPIFHDADLPLGAACDADEACVSGFCWMGISTWVCAEPCPTAENPGAGLGLVCQEISDANAPTTGAACIPSPGAGDIGDACLAGEFDCATGLCFESRFCTDLCDPSASACPGGTTCSLLGQTSSGDLYLCVPDGEVGGAGEGEDCSGEFDCAAGLVCLTGTCTRECPNGNECLGTTYCADDHPAGPICLDNGTRVDFGDACERTSQCPDGGVCFDNGDGAVCRDTCTVPGDCTTPQTCVQTPTGAQLDTVVKVFANDTATTPVAENDDTPTSYFSRLTYAVPGTGSVTLVIEVSRFANSPAGAYELDVFTTSASSTPVNESEAPSNNTRPNAQVLTAPARVVASFVDAGSADVDNFRVTVPGGSTLTVETTATRQGLCSDAPALAADGAPCSSDDACQNSCFPFWRGTGTSFCAKDCAQPADCAGGVCQSFSDVQPATSFCFAAGDVGLADKAFGDTCNGPHECASRRCLKHKYSDTYRCGDTCAAANSACSGVGMCSTTNPIYGTACVPHLGGTVAAGGDCVWSEDCQVGNQCVAEKCQPVAAVTRYDVNPDVALGLPCNIDADCGSGTCAYASELDGFFCVPGAWAGCIGGVSDNVKDPSEVCDGAALGGATCATLGLGTGTPTCAADCGGFDTSTCSVDLGNGRPCNADADCTSNNCFVGGNTWFCASSCTGPSDASCTGTLFAGNLAVACRDDGNGAFACLPAPGQGQTPDPCRSGYLDCDSGSCYAEAFCLSSCTLANPECARDSSCVSFEVDRSVDTIISLRNGSDAQIASNDDIRYPDNLWSAVRYDNAGAEQTLYVRVSAFSSGASGDYQLQCFADDAPPPFGTPVLESELRQVPVSNNTLGTAQALTAVQPARVAASFASGSDVDYFQVRVPAGGTLVATTTFPLSQICWPDERLGKTANEECQFDFECTSGACLGGLCRADCTFGGACAPSFTCGQPTDSERAFCFRPLAFGDACEGSPRDPLDPQSETAILCPNGRCLAANLGIGDAPFCADDCLSEEPGTGCGNYNSGTGRFDGECTDIDESGLGPDWTCLPHLGRSVAAGGGCYLDGDCQSNCCNWSGPNVGTCASASATSCHRDE